MSVAVRTDREHQFCLLVFGFKCDDDSVLQTHLSTLLHFLFLSDALFTTKHPRMEINIKHTYKKKATNCISKQKADSSLILRVVCVLIFFLRLIVSQPFSDPWITSHFLLILLCVLVWTVILVFSCFGKYLFVKEIDVKQKEKKKELCPEMTAMFSDDEKRKRAGKGVRVRLDCLSVMEEGKWFYQACTHNPCKSFIICYNLAPDKLTIKFKDIPISVLQFITDSPFFVWMKFIRTQISKGWWVSKSSVTYWPNDTIHTTYPL